MKKSQVKNVVALMLPGMFLAVIAFNTGVYMVQGWGWYPVIAALPLYPGFALLLGLSQKMIHRLSGYGIDLRGVRFWKFLINHLIAFMIANSVYWGMLSHFPAVDFRLLAGPPMTLTLLLSAWFNHYALRTTQKDSRHDP